jgi:hypothetical protein
MRVTVEAERLGISVEALLKRFIDEHAALTGPAQAALAAWASRHPGCSAPARYLR